MEVTPENVQNRESKSWLPRHYLTSHFLPHLLIVRSVLVAANTKIANYILETKRIFFPALPSLERTQLPRYVDPYLLGIYQYPRTILKIH